MDKRKAIATAIAALEYAGGQKGSPPASGDCEDATKKIKRISIEATDGEKTTEENI